MAMLDVTSSCGGVWRGSEVTLNVKVQVLCFAPWLCQPTVRLCFKLEGHAATTQDLQFIVQADIVAAVAAPGCT